MANSSVPQTAVKFQGNYARYEAAGWFVAAECPECKARIYQDDGDKPEMIDQYLCPSCRFAGGDHYRDKDLPGILRSEWDV